MKRFNKKVVFIILFLVFTNKIFAGSFGENTSKSIDKPLPSFLSNKFLKLKLNNCFFTAVLLGIEKQRKVYELFEIAVQSKDIETGYNKVTGYLQISFYANSDKNIAIKLINPASGGVLQSLNFVATKGLNQTTFKIEDASRQAYRTMYYLKLSDELSVYKTQKIFVEKM
jgi:hypothetical protein